MKRETPKSVRKARSVCAKSMAASAWRNDSKLLIAVLAWSESGDTPPQPTGTPLAKRT